MNRRGFLGSMLAAGVAPMIARSGVLMPVRKLIVPTAPRLALPMATGFITILDSEGQPLRLLCA